MLLGDKLKQVRLDNKLTIDEVVEKLNRYDINVNKGTISRWERNIQEPKNTFVSAYAKAFNLDLNDLYDIETSQSTYSSGYPIPLIGNIAAGSPILAEENIEDYFNIDHSVKADFALRIKGNSMIDANIHDGDIVFIKSQSTLENGEIGAVIINDEATLKRFYHQDGVIILRPENTDYDPIIVTDGNVRIAGKLCAVLSIQ